MIFVLVGILTLFNFTREVGADTSSDINPTNVTAAYDASSGCVKISWTNPNVNYLEQAFIYRSFSGSTNLGDMIGAGYLGESDAGQVSTFYDCSYDSSDKPASDQGYYYYNPGSPYEGHAYYYTVRLKTVGGKESTNIDGKEVTVPASLAPIPREIVLSYSLSSSPSSVLADGEAISNVVVIAKDSQGNLVSGKQVSISSSRDSLDAIKTVVGATSSEGKAVFSVSSKTEGVSTYTATVDSSVINQTTQVTFRKPEAIYSEGTLIQVKGDATIYVIKEGEKRPIPSPSVLRDNGYSFDKVIKIEKTISDQYPTGDTNFYRDGKVLKYGQDIYVISHQEKKRVTSPDALRRFSYTRIIKVTKEIIDSYPGGEPLNATDLYPDGTLLKASNSPAVYYLWGNKLNAIYSADVFNAYNNQWQDVVTVSPAEIKKYPKGGTFYFPKGALIKQAGKSAVYLIDDNDKKRPIVSGEIFEKLGFEWKNINETEAAVVNRYSAGEVIKE